uniref:Uncharacterized protein n=1 Tax=Anopheles funestus TaxID=62324 RepID=A0A4Y0BKJ9_ANOFN
MKEKFHPPPHNRPAPLPTVRNVREEGKTSSAVYKSIFSAMYPECKKNPEATRLRDAPSLCRDDDVGKIRP